MTTIPPVAPAPSAASKAVSVALVVIGLVAAAGPFFQPLSTALDPTTYKAICAVISAAALIGAEAKTPAVLAILKSIGAAPLTMIACLSLMAGCNGLFGPAVTAASTDIGPVLACIAASANADTTPSTTTIEAAVMACGVAAADVTQTVQAIEALANTPALAPATAVKVRAMKHKTVAMIDWDDRFGAQSAPVCDERTMCVDCVVTL